MLLAMALVLAAGCHDTTAPVGPAPIDLRGVPEQVVVAGDTLALEPYLWRDFMPTDRPDTRLRASIVVRSVTGRALPAGLAVGRVWVVRGDSAWTPSFGANQSTEADRIEIVGGGGPQWPVGDHVDVVAELRDGGGQTLRVQAKGREIRRTD